MNIDKREHSGIRVHCDVKRCTAHTCTSNMYVKLIKCVGKWWSRHEQPGRFICYISRADWAEHNFSTLRCESFGTCGKEQMTCRRDAWRSCAMKKFGWNKGMYDTSPGCARVVTARELALNFPRLWPRSNSLDRLSRYYYYYLNTPRREERLIKIHGDLAVSLAICIILPGDTIRPRVRRGTPAFLKLRRNPSSSVLEYESKLQSGVMPRMRTAPHFYFRRLSWRPQWKRQFYNNTLLCMFRLRSSRLSGFLVRWEKK